MSCGGSWLGIRTSDKNIAFNRAGANPGQEVPIGAVLRGQLAVRQIMAKCIPLSCSSKRIGLIGVDMRIHDEVRRILREHASAWTVEGYCNTQEAFRDCAARQFDAFIMDIQGACSNLIWVEALRRLKHVAPALPMIVFTARPNEQTVTLSLKAGASGYLVQPVSGKDLLEALTRVIKGGTVLCSQAQDVLGAWLREAPAETEPQCSARSLTAREEQMMTGLYEHLSTKELAARLGVAEGTIHTHLVNIFAKLEVHSRAEACRRYLARPAAVNR
jgi:DNA-binding NarL/FixJ family response regulator